MRLLKRRWGSGNLDRCHYMTRFRSAVGSIPTRRNYLFLILVVQCGTYGTKSREECCKVSSNEGSRLQPDVSNLVRRKTEDEREVFELRALRLG